MPPLVIIPTYNERDNLPMVVEKIRAVAPEAAMLIVDDTSADGTGDLADRLATTDRLLFVLHRPEKLGLGRAYQAGLAWALTRSYDPICTMDADLSHPARRLPDLIRAAQDGAAIALGSRYVREGKIIGWSWDRYLLSWTANWLTRLLLRLRPRDVTAGYKCYRRDFLTQLHLDELVSPGYAFQVEMLQLAKLHARPVVEIPITFHERRVGRSKVSRHELVSSTISLLRLAGRQRGVRQAVKFGLVGSINFLVDLGLTNLLVLAADWSPIPAGVVGTTIALASSFLMNRRWTFRASRGPVVSQASRFLLINGSGAVVNLLIYTALITFFGIWYNFAKILAIGGSGVWNFLGTKYWVFRGELATKKNGAPRVNP